MNEMDRKTLVLIIGHIELIKEYRKYIEGVHAFEEQPVVRDAVVFNLHQIGEFLKRKLTDNIWQSERWNALYREAAHRTLFDGLLVRSETYFVLSCLTEVNRYLQKKKKL